MFPQIVQFLFHNDTTKGWGLVCCTTVYQRWKDYGCVEGAEKWSMLVCFYQLVMNSLERTIH